MVIRRSESPVYLQILCFLLWECIHCKDVLSNRHVSVPVDTPYREKHAGDVDPPATPRSLDGRRGVNSETDPSTYAGRSSFVSDRIRT